MSVANGQFRLLSANARRPENAEEIIASMSAIRYCVPPCMDDVPAQGTYCNISSVRTNFTMVTQLEMISGQYIDDTVTW